MASLAMFPTELCAPNSQANLAEAAGFVEIPTIEGVVNAAE